MKCGIGMQIIFYFCLIYIKVTYGFPSFPDVNWFCLFIYLWVLTSTWKIVRSSVILLLPLLTIINNWSLTINTIAIHKSDKHQGTQYHSITFITNVRHICIKHFDFAACGSGTFGNSCWGNCHCINQPCHPGHGTCPAGGCQSGYKGSTCSTGMWYLWSTLTPTCSISTLTLKNKKVNIKCCAYNAVQE